MTTTRIHLQELEDDTKYLKFTPDQITKINPEEINNCNIIIRTKTDCITYAKITHITDTHITLVYPLNTAIIMLEDSGLIFYMNKNEVKMPCTNANYRPFRWFQCFS
jgi:hypothetical protein